MRDDTRHRSEVIGIALTIVILGAVAGCVQDPNATDPAYLRIEATEDLE